MHPNSSHGRLKTSVWAFATYGLIPTGIALGVGIYLGLQGEQAKRATVESARIQEVSSQSRLLVDNFWSSVDSVKSQALSLVQLRTAATILASQAQSTGPQRTQTSMPVPVTPILHWAEFDVGNDSSIHLKQSARNPVAKIAWQSGAPQAFEDFYLHLLTEKVSMREIQENGVSILRVKQDPHRPQEWLALAFSEGPNRNAIVVALVDAMDAFSVFKRWTNKTEAGTGLRGYLIGVDGAVVAHTQPSYVGSSFKDAPVFSAGVRTMLQGTRSNGSGVYQSIDQLSVFAGYTRLGTLPLGVVVERVGAESASSAWTWIVKLSKQSGVAAVLLFSMVTLGAWLFRRKVSANETQSTTEEEVLDLSLPDASSLEVAPAQIHGRTEIPMPEIIAIPSPQTAGVPLDAGKIVAANPFFTGASPEQIKRHSEAGGQLAQWLESVTVTGAVQSATSTTNDSQFTKRELEIQRAMMRKTQEEYALIALFEKEAAQYKDPKAVAHRMVQITSQLCSSPCLFFTYHEGLRSAILQADAGFIAGDSPAGMSFPIEAAAIDKIAQAERAGKLGSLSDDPALTRILMARLGVAHFEAWAVTGFSHLGRIAGKPRLLGVLVILQAGVDSVSKHDSLSRMMRITGLVYENTLLSQ